MSDPAGREDLEALEARLDKARERQHPDPRKVATSALAEGTRHAFGIAATTVVGGGIGWVLDRWLDTRPWMLLLFLLLGIAAGFWDLWKAVDREARLIRSQERAGKQDNEG